MGLSGERNGLAVRLGICMTWQPFMNEKPDTLSQRCNSLVENMLFMCAGIKVYSKSGALSSVTGARM